MVSLVAFYPLNDSAWRLVWSSDLTNPTFRVYRDGILIDTTTLTEEIVFIPPGTSPVFEVLDNASPPMPAFPSTVMLSWLTVPGTDYYDIDQFDGANWNNLKQIPDDGSAVMSWESDPQPDGEIATFRVVPVGENGNAGTPLAIGKLVVRVPDPPACTMTYSASTHVVTIS